MQKIVRNQFLGWGFLAAIMFGMGAAALAEQQGHPVARMVMKACKADIQSLCSGIEPGGGRILACLKDHDDKVSSGCKDGLAQAKAARDAQPVASN